MVDGDGGASRVAATRSEVTAYTHQPGTRGCLPFGPPPDYPRTPTKVTASRSTSTHISANSNSSEISHLHRQHC